jgi:hypothetical protein
LDLIPLNLDNRVSAVLLANMAEAEKLMQAQKIMEKER